MYRPPLILLFVLGLVWPSVPALAQGGRPATSVRVDEVRLESLVHRRRITGELRAISRAEVATIEAGLVVELPVRIGQRVTRGDVLARLDDRRARLEVLRLGASLVVAGARVDARAAELARAQREFDIIAALDAASYPKERADAESAVAVAAADHAAAIADVTELDTRRDLAQVRLDDLTIKAPFDGVVIVRSAELGAWRAEGDTIVELLAVDAYRAWLDVPEAMAGSLRTPNLKLQVDIEATGERRGDLDPVVVPLVDTAARTFGVYVNVQNADGVLKPGMSVIGWIPTGDATEYLTLPRNALMRNDAGFFVYSAVPGPEGSTSAAPVGVDVLFDVGTRVAVRSSGLRGGAQVVVEGNERLFPMMPIAPIAADRDVSGDDQ